MEADSEEAKQRMQGGVQLMSIENDYDYTFALLRQQFLSILETNGQQSLSKRKK